MRFVMTKKRLTDYLAELLKWANQKGLTQVADSTRQLSRSLDSVQEDPPDLPVGN